MRKINATIVIAIWTALTGVAASQPYHLVWVSSQPEVTRTGAFMSVCIEPVEGVAVLKEFANDIRWGSGSKQSPKNAASMLPYFSTPALVTADCLEEMISEYKAMFGQDDLTVRDLN